MRLAPLQLFLLKLFVFFAEAFDATGRVHQLLFAGKKRMTIGANFHADIGFGGSSLDNIAAGTFNLCCIVFWMNIWFHFIINPPWN